MSIIKKCDICDVVLTEDSMSVQTQDFPVPQADGRPTVMLRLQSGIATIGSGELCRSCMVRSALTAAQAYQAAHPEV
jgi:hypothetical protein